MKIDNNITSKPHMAQSFTSLQSLHLEKENWVTQRIAIALKDSNPFREFCSKRDVFVKVGMEKIENEFEKPVVNVVCKKSGLKGFFTRETNEGEFNIRFSGDINGYDSPNMLVATKRNTPNYEDTMCGAIANIMKMTKDAYENILMTTNKENNSVVIKLGNNK